MALSRLGLLAPGFGLQAQGDARRVRKPLDHSSSVCLNKGPLILLGEKILWNHPVATDFCVFSQIKIRLNIWLFTYYLYFPMVSLIACIRMWV